MGLFDIFKRRSQKESAVTKEALEKAGGASDSSGGGGGGSFGLDEANAKLAEAGISGVDVSDGVSLGEMGKLLKKAMSGDIHVTPGTAQNIDLRGSGAKEEIQEALRKHGINPEDHGKTIDASKVPGLQEEVQKILAKHGVNMTGGSIDMRSND